MAAVSSQPCTAWSGGCSRAPPEAAPEPRARREGRAPRPSRMDGGVPGAHPNWLGGNRTLTHTEPRGRSRPASWQGPSRPARRRGQWGTARQEPANTQTRLWKLAAALSRRWRRLSRDGEQPLLVLPTPCPSPAPRSLPPAGPAHRRPLLHGPRCARSHTQPPSRARRATLRSVLAVTWPGPHSPSQWRAALPPPRAPRPVLRGRAPLSVVVWGLVALGFIFRFSYKGVVPNQI